MAVFTETIELEDKVSDPAKGAEASILRLVDAMGGVSNQTGGLAESMGGLTSASGTATDATTDLTKGMGDATTGGAGMQMELAEVTGGLSLVAEAAGIAALAIGAVVVAGAAFAIKSSEAKDASIAMFNALGRGKVTGEQVDDMLDGLRGSLGLTKDQLAPLTQRFLQMGVTGTDQLSKLTTAAASANATIKGSGDAFANLYQKLTAQADLGQPFKIAAKGAGSLLGMGLDINDLAKRMGVSATELGNKLKVGLDPKTARKFGDAMQDALIDQGAGPLAQLANSSKNLGELLQEYLGDLFEDLGKDIQPFMAEVKSLFSILDSKANPSGEALKDGIGGFFKEVFSLATKVVPYIKHFLLDVIIYGLKAYIALKPIVKTLTELWKQHDGLGLLKKGLEFVAVALAIVAAGVLVMLSPFIIAGALFVALVAGIVALGVAFSELSNYITGALVSAGAALNEWVLGAEEVAKNFIAGLVKGITDGAGAVVTAVKGLASSAMNSITGALGIHSPSTVMMKLGGHVAGGLAEGIDGGAGDVAASASGLASATVKGASGAAGAAGAPGPSGGGGGINVTVEAGAIVIQGGSGQGAAELTEEGVSMIFERVALGAGL